MNPLQMDIETEPRTSKQRSLFSGFYSAQECLDVGGPIGVGAGFLVLGLIGVRVVEPTPITMNLPRSFGRAILCVVGALVIVCGLCILYNADLLYPWVAGIGTVVMGLVIFLGGLIERHRDN